MAKNNFRKEIPAIKVNQWLEDWEKIQFTDHAPRRQPDPCFYIFKMNAKELKALAGIYKRTTEGGLERSKDLGIQRPHNQERSFIISEFIKYGYPWSELSKSKRESGKFEDLRKPGWLPTSIIVNIVKPDVKRPKQKVDENDFLSIEDDGSDIVKILLPKDFSGGDWKPRAEHPIEVIDGQHRLWAFEDADFKGDFELPVVAFYGLDVSWQAYLFWTINVKPIRINTSLAFDLYPLLRTEDWLEKFEGPAVYRETRAQELVEALWSYQGSPWYQRINMLGETGMPFVSQAAWVRSLIATYIKPWEGKRINIGGLFGAEMGRDHIVLPWSRPQQAAFLITVWHELEKAIAECKYEWAMKLRKEEDSTIKTDAAFSGKNTLLNTDQGVRSVLNITNDLFYLNSDDLGLAEWEMEDGEDLESAVESLNKEKRIVEFATQISKALAMYDWRTANADLSDEEKTLKLAFRGSGGYKELRRQLLKLLAKEKGVIGESAKYSIEVLGY